MYDSLPYSADCQGGVLPGEGLGRPRPALPRPTLARRLGLVALALLLALTFELGPVAKAREAEAVVPIAVPAAVGYGLIAILGIYGVSTVGMNASSLAELWGAFTSDYDYAMNCAAQSCAEFIRGAAGGGVEILQNSVEVTAQDIRSLQTALSNAASAGCLALEMFQAYDSRGELNPYYFLLWGFVDWLFAGGYKWYSTTTWEYYGINYATQNFYQKQIGNAILLDSMSATFWQGYGTGSALDEYFFGSCSNPAAWEYNGSFYLPIAKDAHNGMLFLAQMDYDTYWSFVNHESALEISTSSGFMDGWPFVSVGGCEIYTLNFGDLTTLMGYHREFFSPDLSDDFASLYFANILYEFEQRGKPLHLYQVYDETTGSSFCDRIPFTLSAADYMVPDPHSTDLILNGILVGLFTGAVSRMIDWGGGSITDNPDVLPNRDAWTGVGSAIGSAAGIDVGLGVLGKDHVLEGDRVINPGNAYFPPISAQNDSPYTGHTSWGDVLNTTQTGVTSNTWTPDVTTSTTVTTVGSGVTTGEGVNTGVHVTDTDLVTDTVGELVRPGSGTGIEGTAPIPAPLYGLDGALNDLGNSVSGKFPFCVPFWISKALACFASTPEAPKFDWVFKTPVGSYTYRVDLAPYDSVAGIFRTTFNILFIFAFVRLVKLVWDTRKGATDD